MYCTTDNENQEISFRPPPPPPPLSPLTPILPNIDINTSNSSSSSSYYSFFHFPSPYNIPYQDDEGDDDVIFFHDLILPHHQTVTESVVAEVHNMYNHTSGGCSGGEGGGVVCDVPKWEECKKKKKKCEADDQKVPAVAGKIKRSSKKDRHSKINTAQGPRDRRVRLSLDVAQKFFDLQDMLSFDKASKTVEWLLINSKSAIKEITRCSGNNNNNNSASSTSDCEVVSGIVNDSAAVKVKQKQKLPLSLSSFIKEKRARTTSSSSSLRKNTFQPLGRESREKARARARERTREKRDHHLSLEQSQQQQQHVNIIETRYHYNELLHLDGGRGGGGGGSWSSFEESGSKINNNPSLVLSEVGIEGGNWNPSPIFKDHQNATIRQEHQFTDFPFYAKPWEGYNNINL